MPLRGKSGLAYASPSLFLWPLVLLCSLLAGVTCRPEQKPGGRPRKFISYYGHKEVQEGESFIIYCFADTRTKISWSKDGLPLRYWSPWQGYYVSEYNTEDLKVARLEVHAADADFSGGYSCSRESPAKHFVRVTALRDEAGTQPACHVLVPNESLRLYCRVSSPEVESVTWFKDEEELFPDNDRFVAAGKTLEIRRVSEDDAGAYGCSPRRYNDSSVVHILQLVTPVRLEPPQSPVAAPLGARVQLECRAYAHPEPQISWLFGDRSRVSSPLLSVYNASLSHTGSYRCSASHERCARLVAESDVTLNVFESTIRTNEGFPGSGITLTPGNNTLRLKCDYPADRTAKIVWLKENSTLTSSGSKYAFDKEDQSLVINKPETSDVGNYSCVALGRIFNETAVIVVGLKVSIRTSHSKTFKEGHDGFMSCMVDEYPKPTVRWYRNGHLLSAYRNSKFKYGGQRNDEYETLVVRRLDKRDEAVFTCLVDNGHSQDRASFFLSVTVAPSPLTPFFFICAEVVIMTGIAYIVDRSLRGAWIAAQQRPEPQRPAQKRVRHSSSSRVRRSPKKSFTESDVYRFIQCVESSGDLVLDDIMDLNARSEKPQSKDIDIAVEEKRPKFALTASDKPATAFEHRVEFKPSERTDAKATSRKKKRRKKKESIGDETQKEFSQLPQSGPGSYPPDETVVKEAPAKPDEDYAKGKPDLARKKQRQRLRRSLDADEALEAPLTTPLEKEKAQQVREKPIGKFQFSKKEELKAQQAVEEPPSERYASSEKAKVKTASKKPFAASTSPFAEDVEDGPKLQVVGGTTTPPEPFLADNKNTLSPLLYTSQHDAFTDVEYRKDSVMTLVVPEEHYRAVCDSEQEIKRCSPDATEGFLFEDEPLGWTSVEHKPIEYNEQKPILTAGKMPQVDHEELGFVENTMEEGRTLGKAKQRKGKRGSRTLKSDDKTYGSPEKSEFFFGARSTPKESVQVFSAPYAKDSQEVRDANVTEIIMDERRMGGEHIPIEISKQGDFSTHQEKGEWPILEANRYPPAPIAVALPPIPETQVSLTPEPVDIVQIPDEKRFGTMQEPNSLLFRAEEMPKREEIRFLQPLEEEPLAIAERRPVYVKTGETHKERTNVPLQPPAPAKVFFPAPTADSPSIKPASKKHTTRAEKDYQLDIETPSPIPSPKEVLVRSRRVSRVGPVVTKMPFPGIKKVNKLQEQSTEGKALEPKTTSPVASGGKIAEYHPAYPTLSHEESYTGTPSHNEETDILEAFNAEEKRCELKGDTIVTPLLPIERTVKVDEQELPEESKTLPPYLPDKAMKLTEDTRLPDSIKHTDTSRQIVSLEALKSPPEPLALSEGGGLTTKPEQHPLALVTSPPDSAARMESEGRKGRKQDIDPERRLVERPKVEYAEDNLKPYELPAQKSPEGAYRQHGVTTPKKGAEQQAAMTTRAVGQYSPREGTFKQAYGTIGPKHVVPSPPQETALQERGEWKAQPMQSRSPVVSPEARTQRRGQLLELTSPPENMGQMVEILEGTPVGEGSPQGLGVFGTTAREDRMSVAELKVSSPRTREPNDQVEESKVVDNLGAIVEMPERTFPESSLADSSAVESTVPESDTTTTEEPKGSVHEGEPMLHGSDKTGPLAEIQGRGPFDVLSEAPRTEGTALEEVRQPLATEESSTSESTTYQGTTLVSATTESTGSGSEDRRLVERLTHPVTQKDGLAGEGSFAEDDDFDTIEEQITLYEGLRVPDYQQKGSLSETEYEPPQPSELFSSTASPESDWTQEPDNYYFLSIPPFEFAIPRKEIDGPERVPDFVPKSSKRRRSSSQKRKHRHSHHHSKHGSEQPSGGVPPTAKGSSPGTSARQPESGQIYADASVPSTSRDDGHRQDTERRPQIRHEKERKPKSGKEKRK